MTQAEILRRLSMTRLASEEDVREEFVTPLLKLLGYDHARGEIHRGVALRTPYRSGTSRTAIIIPDYVIRTRNGVHLAIDAKRPGESESESLKMVTDVQYVGQVHSYASHREVRAPWFAIINGSYTAIYESNSSTSDPVLIVSQAELPARFKEIEEIIGKAAISSLLLKRLEPSWVEQVVQAPLGFQPANIAIGDVDQDGLPEIIPAISEDHIPVYRLNGNLAADHVTDGWTWSVQATGTQDPYMSTIVALQHQLGPTDLRGKVIGIGPNGRWERLLRLPGGGMSVGEWDRILVNADGFGSVAVADAGANRVLAFDLAGNQLWESEVGVGAGPWASILRLIPLDEDSFAVLWATETFGALLEVGWADGSTRNSHLLRARPYAAEVINVQSRTFFVGNVAGGGSFVSFGQSVSADLPPRPDRYMHFSLAAGPSGDVLAIGEPSRVTAHSVDALALGEWNLNWESSEVAGMPWRMRWVQRRGVEALILCTCGSLAWPSTNGLYILNPLGVVKQRYLMDRNEFDNEEMLPGFRAFAVVDSLDGGSPAVVAAADDGRLYMWRPRWEA